VFQGDSSVYGAPATLQDRRLLEFASDFFYHDFVNCLSMHSETELLCVLFALGLGCSNAHPQAEPCTAVLTTVEKLSFCLLQLVRSLHDSPFQEECAEILQELPLRTEMVRAFVAHQIRGWYQSKWMDSKFKELDNTTAIVVIDFKNKVLPTYRRESMKLYFGKEGISMLGCMFMFRDGDQCLREFDDCVTSDRQQDGYMSLMLFGCALLRFSERHPDVRMLFLQCDCGPHFDCSSFCAGCTF
jgi:hypothetical protein